MTIIAQPLCYAMGCSCVQCLVLKLMLTLENKPSRFQSDGYMRYGGYAKLSSDTPARRRRLRLFVGLSVVKLPRDA